ncbi:hypothetical protein QJU23_03640 [Pasteurella atlantica]|uniref:Uncharacterized protein n=2 Tax=Pasteurellaceae TaxID=712 RepID=A0ACC6HL17_9PAST|nr:hypothetical protein [Pasteurella atlantica]MDP8051519.1 hypothetical protein [Pasteurella atlantica]MDP8104902.1 hypothetical protein [Pasteurella atlantica]MDP8148276.1 hypothetical protein [Pasteurella atlantica]
MKLFIIVKKFTEGFKEGWYKCGTDKNTIQINDGELNIYDNNFPIFNDSYPNPNDKNHPDHDLYYGK